MINRSRLFALTSSILLIGLAGCEIAPRRSVTAAPRAAATAVAPRPETTAVHCIPAYRPARSDEPILDELEKRIFEYFWNEVYPETGIAVDHTENPVGKVAATGFGLGAICIAVERGWITREQGYERTWRTLNAFYDDPADPDDAYVDGQFGLWWHFMDGHTGRMKPIDCVAMCDSADFIAGVVVAGEYFKGTPVEKLAREIYDNVQWDQFVSKRPDGTPGLLSFGWVPLHVSESYYDVDGLLPFNMSGFVDNSLLIYVLALGSDTHPIPIETWEQYVDSYTLDTYGGYECVMAGALFCRQVPHAFVPFARQRDRKIDYFLDTANALLADRVFNMRENGYPPQLWGLNDCFGKDTYSHAAPPGPVNNDGTVATCSFAGALPHVPGLSLEAIRYALDHHRDQVWGKYGFVSSINLKNGFASPFFVGIELGPMILAIENYRSGLIWDLFKRSPVMANFVERARMCGVLDDFELPPEAPRYAKWTIDTGYVATGSDEPQHGHKYLELHPEGGRAVVTATLTENDLLAYHYDTYLSLWTRDVEPSACYLAIDGRMTPLQKAGTVPSARWMHHYYEIPPHGESSTACGLRIALAVTGDDPAVDNITFERDADLGPPAAIKDLSAGPGRIGSSITLTWTAPADTGTDRAARYIVRTQDRATANEKTFEFAAAKPAGETEERLVVLERIGEHLVQIAAADEHGHMGPVSDAVVAQPNPEPINRVAHSFENGSTEGLESSTPNLTFGIVDDVPGNKCLRVDYRKDHAWNNLTLPVEPMMVALHRYITVRAKGRVKILGKLWCHGDLQQDMEVQMSDSDSTWTTFTYDTSKAGSINPARNPVLKLILFPAPAEWQGEGTFFIDDVAYTN